MANLDIDAMIAKSQETAIPAAPLREAGNPEEIVAHLPAPSEKPTQPIQKFVAGVRSLAATHGAVEDGLFSKVVADTPNVATVVLQYDFPKATFPPELVAEIEKTALKHESRSGSNSWRIDFIERAKELDHQGYTNAGLDLIYDEVDRMCREAEFALLASCLLRCDVVSLPSRVLLALLTTTKRWGKFLDTRRNFLDRAVAELDSRPDFDKRALANLRS